jgi:CubicO group peptidase (beta-lactamase class C family)
MQRLITRRKMAKTLLFLLVVVTLIMAAWVGVAGPVTVYRIMRYGTTTIHDFNHYPGRILNAGDNPFPFVEQAVSTGFLDQANYGQENLSLDRLLQSNDSIAFLIVQDDTILYEQYYQGHTAVSYSQFFSVSKSVLSALIGMAIDDGHIRSVDQPVTDFVPELAGSGFDKITLRHLLHMTSGTNYLENDNPFGIHVRLNYTPTLERDILGIKAEDPPGTYFRYKSGDTALLSLILDRALGVQTITDYAQERLWSPLGMEQGGVWSLDHAPDGLEKTWCCLAATARDLARFGRLYTHHGNWNGRQLLPANWVMDSTRLNAVPEADWPDAFRQIGLWNYGYQWWLVSPERGDFLALGKDGQFLYVDPKTKVVIVRLGESMGQIGTQGWIDLFTRLAQEAGEHTAAVKQYPYE